MLNLYFDTEGIAVLYFIKKRLKLSRYLQRVGAESRRLHSARCQELLSSSAQRALNTGAELTGKLIHSLVAY
jgi:hypothetical protein